MNLFDEETGEILNPGTACPHCEQARRNLMQAERDLQSMDRDHRRTRRERDAARSELSRQRATAVKHKGAEAIFRYWVQRCKKNTKTTVFGEARQKAVLNALTNHTHEYVARAIDGAVSPEWRWSTELEYICRNEVNLERLHSFANPKDTLIGPAWLKEFGA